MLKENIYFRTKARARDRSNPPLPWALESVFGINEGELIMAKTVTTFMDKKGRIVPPEKGVFALRETYDAKGQVVKTEWFTVEEAGLAS